MYLFRHILWATRATVKLSIITTLSITGLAQGGTALAEELQVTKHNIIDAEYDQDYGRFTFTDKAGNLWIGFVDKDTGDFNPPDGHGIWVDSNAAYAADFGNGPEWMFTSEGHQIVYTKYLPDKPHGVRNAGIARARQIGEIWDAAFLTPGLTYHSPAGSQNEGDPDPLIDYQGITPQKNNRSFFSQKLEQPETMVKVPLSDYSNGSRRWVRGTRDLAFVSHGKNIYRRTQIFLYNADQNVSQQLTHDLAKKMSAFMWPAPELGGEYLLFTVANRTELRVYRKSSASPESDAKWEVFFSLETPQRTPYIWSPEVFTHNGKSYIFMVLSDNRDPQDFSAPTHIAIANIDPSSAKLRVLTQGSAPFRVRIDPEVFVTSQGPFIYYNRFTAVNAKQRSFSEGIWRVDTGLGPVLPQEKREQQ